MEEMWRRGEATVRDVQEALNARAEKTRAYTTLLTVMTRLDAKGLLVRRRAGRLDVYAPALSREAYTRWPGPRPRWRCCWRTSATSRWRISPATSSGSTRSGWSNCAGSPAVAECAELRRAEFALAAFGATAFLLSLLYLLDALRFHHHVLVDALAGLPHGDLQPRGLLLLGLAAFDLVALGRAAVSAGRVSAAHRRAAAALPVGEWRRLYGQRVCIVPGAHAAAFCVGLLRRADRRHHRRGGTAGPGRAARRGRPRVPPRRPPRPAAAARRAGGRRRVRPGPGPARAGVVRARGRRGLRAHGGGAPLAAALLAFHDDAAGIAPERVDRLAGRAPLADVPRALVIGAGVVVGLLVVLVASALVVSRPVVCLPLATAPLWTLGAVTARLAVLAPAWLGWRRAATVIKPV